MPVLSHRKNLFTKRNFPRIWLSENRRKESALYKMQPIEHRFETGEQLASSLAQSIAADLRVAIAARGKASLVVSGGRTPAVMFAVLGQYELAWNKVWITLTDERWVDAHHADSNEAMLHRTLLQQHAAAAHLVPLKNAATTAKEGEAESGKNINAMPRPFDVVVLGMGDDGHFASLFPQAPQLSHGLDLANKNFCIAVDPITAPHARMSLTLATLLASRRIVIQLLGEGKWQVYQRALQAGEATELPIRAVLNQTKTAVEVYWAK
jgi:6-phosphogluconolactonase